MTRLSLIGVFLLMALPVLAMQPEERLNDAILEARARTISHEIRCLVCQNQSIDDSDADLARDLRRIIRERLTAGDTDAAVKDFLVMRYGDFVLLRPPFRLSTLVLWLIPFAVLICGGISFWAMSRRTINAPVSLTPEEKLRLEILTKDHP